jgi:K+-sensing histidine kinase KdpD
MNTATLIALGVPALIAAIGYAIKKVGEALSLRAEAAVRRADAAKTRADTEKADADTTGRIVIGREADAETIRLAFREMRERLDRCEKRHELQEARHEKDREEWRKAMAAKEAQIEALWREVGSLRDAIEGARS